MPAYDAEDKVEQAEIVGGLFGPADEDGAEAVEPGMCPLHHPAPCCGSGMTLGPGFLATTAQMQRKGELLRQRPRLIIVDALVKAEVLRGTARRLGPLHRDGLKGLAHQLMVVAIGARSRPQGGCRDRRSAASVSPRSCLCRSDCGRSFPRPAAPCRSPHPVPARSNRLPSGRYRPTTPRARRL